MGSTLPSAQNITEQGDPKLRLVAAEIQTIGGLAAGILQVIPGATSAGALTALLTLLVAKAMNAYSLALGKPVTPESILELLPDQTPLVEPKE